MPFTEIFDIQIRSTCLIDFYVPTKLPSTTPKGFCHRFACLAKFLVINRVLLSVKPAVKWIARFSAAGVLRLDPERSLALLIFLRHSMEVLS